MKILIAILLLPLSLMADQSLMAGIPTTGAPQNSTVGVIFYLKAKSNSEKEIANFHQVELPALKKVQTQSLPNTKMGVYYAANKEAKLTVFFANLFRSWPWVNVPLLINKEPPAVLPFSHSLLKPILDVVIEMDFPGTLTSREEQVIAEIKAKYSQKFKVTVGLTRKYQFLDRGNANSSDYRIAFLVPWKKGMNKAESQNIWLNHHGPLALTVLPEELKTYVQHHSDLNYEGRAPFDQYYQGICFENVDSAATLKSLAKHEGAWKASMLLAADEEKFIGHPTFMVLKPASLYTP